jgi:hypothetical protein
MVSILAATSYLLETQATRLLQSQSESETATDARTDAEALEKLEKENGTRRTGKADAVSAVGSVKT